MRIVVAQAIRPATAAEAPTGLRYVQSEQSALDATAILTATLPTTRGR